MREAELQYPLVTRGKFLKKIILNAVIRLFSFSAITYGLFVLFVEKLLRQKFDQFITKLGSIPFFADLPLATSGDLLEVISSL